MDMSRGTGLAVVVRHVLCVVVVRRRSWSLLLCVIVCIVSCGRGRGRGHGHGRESFAIIVHRVMIMHRPSSSWIVCCRRVLSTVMFCPLSAAICPPSPLCAIQRGLDLPQVLVPVILIIPVVLPVLITGILYSGSVVTVHMQTHK